MIEILHSSSPSVGVAGPVFTREDHRLKELALVGTSKRAPRRSQTYQDYAIPQFSVSVINNILQQLRVTEDAAPTNSPSPAAAEKTEQEPPRQAASPRRRPPLGPARRSYSVTDHEPISHYQTPSTGITLLDLPAELHYALFDFLDDIDSTCLGLVSKHFYAIYRRLRGRVSLAARREGPNDLEWAWHLAGAPVVVESDDKTNKECKTALSKLRIRGQGYCRKCGVTRCELHKHLREWMGDGVEYCCVTQKFGQVAREGAKSYCYMSSPKFPHRCGRHWVKKSKVVLQ